MAGIVDKFKRMWDAPDDEYEYDEYGYADEGEDDYEEPAPRERERERDRERERSYAPAPAAAPASRNKVVNINATAKLQVGIFKPERFGDETRSIAEELMTTNTVVLNLEELLCQIAQLEGISVKGLMTIPPVCENKHKNLKYFYNMHKLFIDISEKKLDNVSMTILSMGMSSDFYEAILEGANMVRIGSALFGARNYT